METLIIALVMFFINISASAQTSIAHYVQKDGVISYEINELNKNSEQVVRDDRDPFFSIVVGKPAKFVYINSHVGDFKHDQMWYKLYYTIEGKKEKSVYVFTDQEYDNWLIIMRRDPHMKKIH